ncbi:MAG: hypothetical protein HY075_01150 [Deltaproteobacteria bacterium]|nr:hypothetical protein [Deltaproteobacteria bacterium]
MASVLVLLLGIVFPLLAGVAQANDRESHFLASGELGARYHTGTKGKSWDKAVGPYAYFQSEARRGALCPNMGVALELITGNATLPSGGVTGTALTGAIYPGLDVFFTRATKLQPFVDVHGIASWNYVSLSPVVPATAEKSLALGFGFEAGIGLHYYYHGGSRAYRVHASYMSYTAKVSEQTGFQFTGYGLSLGLAF